MPAPPLPLGASKIPRPPECCPALYINSAVPMNATTFTMATIQTVEFKRPFISPPHPLLSLRSGRWQRLLIISSSLQLVLGIRYLVFGTWYLVALVPTTNYQVPTTKYPFVKSAPPET